MLNHIQLMGRYNQWMNNRLYITAGKLDDAALAADQGVFFKSVLGTLNHIMVADLVWLKRFATHPATYSALDYVRSIDKPSSLDLMLYQDFSALDAQRKLLDQVIIDWCCQLTATDLAHKLVYNNMKGESFTKNYGSLIFHFFNHQTHHRGQITTLLSQNNLDVGVTDLLVLIPNEEMAV